MHCNQDRLACLANESSEIHFIVMALSQSLGGGCATSRRKAAPPKNEVRISTRHLKTRPSA
jgi:hypothetical protein